MAHNGISITPAKNLVSNIGVGPGATRDQSSFFNHLPTATLSQPLVHPRTQTISAASDAEVLFQYASNTAEATDTPVDLFYKLLHWLKA